ncbi:MAG: chorismate synthase [Candidatus Eisenbacteria bacterium]|nr:chorismate synthase [Candidatus Eisenbacteria bacterium]MCC7141304.1 chorismate synthase [Candidatus Eisenbacteria bacterium]
MSSTYGLLYRIATWGESHGGGVGVVVDGCPAQLPLAVADIQPQLDRRRPGQSRIVTPRQEADRVSILSGVFEGKTLGTPILLSVPNEDARPGAYEEMKDLYRPSHADFTYDAKYGFRSWQGGGRSSARETIGRVAAGAIAEKILRLAEGIEIVAYVRSIAGVSGDFLDPLREVSGGDRGTGTRAVGTGRSGGGRSGRAGTAPGGSLDPLTLTRTLVDRTPVRCPDVAAAERMIALIEAARRAGDSVGGVIECVIRNVPAGLGEPVFDRLEADLGKAMLALPATKGFEVGSGFAGTLLRGSEHNDAYIARRAPAGRSSSRTSGTAGTSGTVGTVGASGASGTSGPGSRMIGTRTNRSGGIQGGISDGEPIVFRVAFKPTATIRHPQETVDTRGRRQTLSARGRHDPCVLPRAVPMVETMAALVLVDHWMRQLALREASSRVVAGARLERKPRSRRT